MNVEILSKSISWKVVAASVRGTSHERNSLVCQDAHEWQIANGGWLVASVADGAGSAALAEVGAKLAVHVSVKEMVKTINDRLKQDSLPQSKDAWQVILRDILQTTRDALISEANIRQSKAHDLACTLILVVLGPSITIAAQIGDGAAIQRKNENIQALTRPEPTEYLNEVTFLTSTGAIETAQFVIDDASVDSIAVFSDGLQTLALEYPNWNPFLPFFKPIFAFVEEREDIISATAELESFLKSERIRKRSDDDLTLLLAARKINQSKISRWICRFLKIPMAKN